MDTPRTVYIAFDVFPRPKGSSSHMAFMVTSLAESRGPVWLLCLGYADMPSVQMEGNITIHRFTVHHPHILKRALAFAEFVSSRLKGAGSRVEYLFFRDPWGGVPALHCKVGKVKVFEVNALPSMELPYLYPALAGNFPLLEKLRDQEGRCLKEADSIIAVSGVTRHLLSCLGVRGDKITVLPNAASDVFFSGAGIPSPIPVLSRGRWFGYLGSLHPWQGLETVLDAFSMVQGDIPDTGMLIVTGDRGPARRAIRKRIQKLGLSDRVLIQPPLPPEQVAAVMARLRFTVAPLRETLRNTLQGCCPVKIIESMATGTPVLASDLAPCREIITQGQDGLLIPAGDSRRWAVAIRRLCREDVLHGTLSERAKKKAKECFHHRQLYARLDAWLATFSPHVREPVTLNPPGTDKMPSVPGEPQLPIPFAPVALKHGDTRCDSWRVPVQPQRHEGAKKEYDV